MGMLNKQTVRIILIRYGHSKRWNALLTSGLSLPFVKAFKIYQIRWNIEILNKETKQYLELWGYQEHNFDGQIADRTIYVITYIILVLEKRFAEYETMGRCSPTWRAISWCSRCRAAYWTAVLGGGFKSYVGFLTSRWTNWQKAQSTIRMPLRLAS